MPGLMLLLCAWAAARDVVVYQGDPVAALEAAAADLHVEPSALRPLRTDELPGLHAPALLGAARPFCATAGTSNAGVRDLVNRAEGHLSYQRTPEARAALDTASAQLGCLPEPIEASLAGRLAYLRGVVALREGAQADAAAAFRLAATFQPGLQWDGRFPPDSTGTFDAAVRPAPGAVSVPVGLGPGATLWVDGRAAPAGGVLTLPPGRHYLQVLDGPHAWTTTLDATADLGAALVTPGWLAAVDLDRLDDPSARRLFADAVGVALPGEEVYARVRGRTVRLDGTWTELAHRAVRTPICAVARRCLGATFLGAGVGGITAGGAVLVLGELRVNALAASPAGEDAAGYQARVGAQEEARRWLPVGGAIAGAGVVFAAVGVVLERPGVAVSWTGAGVRADWAF